MSWLLPFNCLGRTNSLTDSGGRFFAGPARLLFVHVFTLTSLAISAPVYSLIGLHAGFVIDMELGLAAVGCLVFMLSVVLPAALSFGQWGLARLFPRAAPGACVVIVFALLTLIAMPAMKRAVMLPGWMMIFLSLAAAAAATCAYFRFRPVQSLVTCATPGVLVFPAVLLFGSPVAGIWFPTKTNVTASRKASTPVVLIVFDEFCGMTLMDQNREVDGVRFPHFAELARGSTWYRNATTVHADTLQAVPAIVTGRYPSNVEFPTVNPQQTQNLFSVLHKSHGYELAAFEPITRLAPDETVRNAVSTTEVLQQFVAAAPTLMAAYKYFLCPLDLYEHLQPLPPEWFGAKHQKRVDRQKRGGVCRYDWGDDRRGQFEHFLECIVSQSHSTLYFIHDVLPHVNWCYLPSGRRYIPEGSWWQLLDFNTRNSMIGFWGADELFVIHSQQRYLLQVEFVDALIGRLLCRLKETGVYDDCLLIVTADHGVSFRPQQARRAPSADNLADIMSVPLFIKTPGQRSGVISDRNVETIDILPTVADVLGFELPLPVDGRSVFDGTTPERNHKTILDAQLAARTVPAAIVASSTFPQELRQRFGEANDPLALFRIGPRPELVGRAVADFIQDDDSTVDVELLRYGSDYAPDGDAIVPCYVEGRVVLREGPALERPLSIAVAVNGTIRAVTRTYHLQGWHENWAAMVPESAFRAGQNDVQFYVVTGASSATRLARCRAAVSGGTRS